MSSPLTGRTVFLTGAAGGIGAATARAAVARGARVVLTDVDAAALDALVAELGPDRAHAAVVDVTDRASVDAGVASAVERFGGIDVVVANAGIVVDPPTTVLAVAPADFERVLDVDLLGVWRTVHAALPHVVAARGHVVAVSSVYAFVNGVVNAPYAMSKAGVEQFARALRVELAPHGATAGVLYPGWVRTPLTEVAFGRNALATQMRERAFPWPLAAAIRPERVATALLDGIERRAARTVVPRRWIPASLLRGLVNPVIDWNLTRDKTFRDLLRRLEVTERHAHD